MNKRYLFFIVILTFVLLSGGCSYLGDGLPVISSKPDSEYVNTFKALNLGVLFDFNLYLPNSDRSWVTIWVERYEEGKKDTNPLMQLSFGHSPLEKHEGRLGFGMINPNEEKTTTINKYNQEEREF